MLGFITDQMFKPRMAFSKLALLPYILSKNKIKVIYKGRDRKKSLTQFPLLYAEPSSSSSNNNCTYHRENFEQKA